MRKLLILLLWATVALGQTTTTANYTITVTGGTPPPPPPPAAAPTNYYSTSGPLTENPISQGSAWIGGQVAGGNLWGNVQTNAGLIFGVSEPTQFGDPTAVLNQTWAIPQTALGVIKILTAQTSGTHEVELRLLSTISASSITGYEITCSVTSGTPYLQIVRWNGPNAQYVFIGSSTHQCVNGDILQATATLDAANEVVIQVFVNGVLNATGCDNGQASGFSGTCNGQSISYSGPGGAAGPFRTGATGVGFYDPQDSNWAQFGWGYWWASTGAPAAVPTITAARAIDWNGFAGPCAPGMPNFNDAPCGGVAGPIPRTAAYTGAGTSGGAVQPEGAPGAPVAYATSNLLTALTGCSNQVVNMAAGSFYYSTTAYFPGSNCTLRGAGADKTLVHFIVSNSSVRQGFQVNNPNSLGCCQTATWSGNFGQSQNVITITGATAQPTVGTMIELLECNDGRSGASCGTGVTIDSGAQTVCGHDVFCSTNGSVNGSATQREYQVVEVFAVTGTCSSSCNVGIWPPLYNDNWASSKSPTLSWETNGGKFNGIEDATVDSLGAAPGNGINYYGVASTSCLSCWGKGLRMIATQSSAGIIGDLNVLDSMNFGWINNYDTTGGTWIRQGGNNHGYSLTNARECNGLYLNNIGVGTTAWLPGTMCGNVYAYNYIAHTTTADGVDMNAQIQTHDVENDHLLIEGNEMAAVMYDGIWGEGSSSNTMFRNVLFGADYPYVTLSNQTGAVFEFELGTRVASVVGNVVGYSGVIGYQRTPAAQGAPGTPFIYTLGFRPGFLPRDMLIPTTMFRWGNFDTINGTSQFNSAEVPSALHAYAGFQQSLGTGNGSTTTFSGTLAHVPCLFGNEVGYINNGATLAWDAAANGTLAGTGISGTVNCTTGAVSLTFTTAPGSGVGVFMNYVQDTGAASPYQVPLPANHSLPLSFYYTNLDAGTSGTNLPFGKICTNYSTASGCGGTFKTIPIPTVGPDVTGGTLNGCPPTTCNYGAAGASLANDNAAYTAWSTLPVDVTYRNTTSITNATWSAGVATVTLSTAPDALMNGEFTISGVTPSGYNGTFLLSNLSGSQVSYNLAANPGTFVSGGSLLFPNIRIFNETVYQADTVPTPILSPNNSQTGNSANSLQPPALTFGNQGTNTSSMAIPISINNCSTINIPACTGNGNLILAATPLAISGTNQADFTFALGTCSANQVIASGGSCSPTIAFKPTTTAGTAETATLTVNYANGVAASTMALTGTSATVVALPACGSTLTGTTIYQATANVTCPGIAYSFTGCPVVNLNGFTVTWNNTAQTTPTGAFLTGGFNECITVYNGVISQGAGTNSLSTTYTDSFLSAIGPGAGNLNFADNNAFFNLTFNQSFQYWSAIDTLGPGSTGGNLIVHDVTINDSAVGNCGNPACRSQLQSTAIRQPAAVNQPATPTHYYNNTINGSAQGGMMAQAPGAIVEHNLVNIGNAAGTNSNNFGIYVWGPVTAHDNIINIPLGSNTNGRGLAMQGDGGAGSKSSFNNVIQAFELPNSTEYASNGRCEIGGAYGIQYDDNPQGPSINSNANVITVQVNKCGGTGLRLTDTELTTNTSTNNTYTASRQSSALDCTIQTEADPNFGCAFGVSIDGNSSPTATAFTSTNDTFIADSGMILIGEAGIPVSNIVFQSPTFTKGSNPSATWHTFWASNGVAGSLKVIDATTGPGVSLTDTRFLAQSSVQAPVSLFIQWTQTVLVQTTGAVPISGATVTYTDAENATYTCTTGSNGICPVVVTQYRLNNDTAANQIENHNNYSRSVSATGHTTNTASNLVITSPNSVTVTLN